MALTNDDDDGAVDDFDDTSTDELPGYLDDGDFQ